MIKGGDFRAREANVYRIAEVSNQVIDHYTALGVPFAREYGGSLDTRSFGGVPGFTHLLCPKRADRTAVSSWRIFIT